MIIIDLPSSGDKRAAMIKEMNTCAVHFISPPLLSNIQYVNAYTLPHYVEAVKPGSGSDETV
jgi:hypothetical protein